MKTKQFISLDGALELYTRSKFKSTRATSLENQFMPGPPTESLHKNFFENTEGNAVMILILCHLGISNFHIKIFKHKERECENPELETPERTEQRTNINTMFTHQELRKRLLASRMYFDRHIFAVGWILLSLPNRDLFSSYEAKIKVNQSRRKNSWHIAINTVQLCGRRGRFARSVILMPELQITNADL